MITLSGFHLTLTFTYSRRQKKEFPPQKFYFLGSILPNFFAKGKVAGARRLAKKYVVQFHQQSSMAKNAIYQKRRSNFDEIDPKKLSSETN